MGMPARLHDAARVSVSSRSQRSPTATPSPAAPLSTARENWICPVGGKNSICGVDLRLRGDAEGQNRLSACCQIVVTTLSHLPCGERDNVKVHLTALSSRRDGGTFAIAPVQSASLGRTAPMPTGWWPTTDPNPRQSRCACGQGRSPSRASCPSSHPWPTPSSAPSRRTDQPRPTHRSWRYSSSPGNPSSARRAWRRWAARACCLGPPAASAAARCRRVGATRRTPCCSSRRRRGAAGRAEFGGHLLQRPRLGDQPVQQVGPHPGNAELGDPGGGALVGVALALAGE
jgi:hypothetical protein